MIIAEVQDHGIPLGDISIFIEITNARNDGFLICGCVSLRANAPIDLTFAKEHQRSTTHSNRAVIPRLDYHYKEQTSMERNPIDSELSMKRFP